MDAQKRRKLHILYLVSFLDLFAVSLAVPLMSSHMKDLGASHTLISLASTAFHVTQLITGPLVGSWSDRRGRGQILILCLSLCSFGYLTLGVAKACSVILLTRIFIGCFKHTQVICKTILSDIVPPRDQPGAIGILSAISGTGFIIGPAIGGHFAEKQGGFTFLCYVITATFWVNAILVYFFLMNTEGPRGKAAGDPGATTINRLKVELDSVIAPLANVEWKSYGDIFALKVCLSLTGAFYFNNYSLSLRERFEISPKVVGYLISFQSLIGSASGFLSSYVQRAYVRFYGPRDVTLTRVIHAYGLLAVGLLGHWAAASLGSLVAWLGPIGASQSALRNLLTELLLRRCPQTERGSVVGSAHSLSAIARITAPLVAGMAEDSVGVSATVVLAQLVATGGLLLSLDMSMRQAKRQA